MAEVSKKLLMAVSETGIADLFSCPPMMHRNNFIVSPCRFVVSVEVNLVAFPCFLFEI
jgi:hypothetical protein